MVLYNNDSIKGSHAFSHGKTLHEVQCRETNEYNNCQIGINKCHVIPNKYKFAVQTETCSCEAQL